MNILQNLYTILTKMIIGALIMKKMGALRDRKLDKAHWIAYDSNEFRACALDLRPLEMGDGIIWLQYRMLQSARAFP